MKRFLSSTTGFSTVRANGDSHIEAVVRQATSPVSEDDRADFGFVSRKDHRIADLCRKAGRAYLVDGMLRQAVDKYTELCRNPSLDGEDRPVAYVKKRLELLGLIGDEDWQSFVDVGVHEFVKTGNWFFTKVRGNVSGARRALYKNKPFPIAAVYPVSVDRLEPGYDEDSSWRGWKFNDCWSNDGPDLLLPGTEIKPGARGQAWILKPEVKDKAILQPGLDIVQVAYKKGADTRFGNGVTFQGVEDFALFRGIEKIVATVIKKNSHPLFHHKVLRPTSTYANMDMEISKAGVMHRRSAPDGVIVTGGNHEITAIGSESQALRMEGYLDHYMKRACAGIGMSPYLLGFEAATLGTAEAATKILLDKVRVMQQQIARAVERFLLWELLWEGGFDPYNNEADRVFLVFEEVDIDRQIKWETHLADLYAKNVIDIDETRVPMRRRKPYNLAKLYLNQVQIPLAKVTEETKIEVARIGAQAKKKTASEVRRMAEAIFPTREAEVDDFILLCERIHGVDRERLLPIADNMRTLVNDPEALMELLIQTLSEAP